MSTPKNQALATQKPTGNDAVIASFYDLDGFADAVVSSEFTFREEIALLIDAMRCDDPKIRLAAQKQWRTMRRDLLETNGLLGTAKAREVQDDGQGRVIEHTVTAQTLLSRVREHQEKTSNANSARHDPSFKFLAPRAITPEPLTRLEEEKVPLVIRDDEPQDP